MVKNTLIECVKHNRITNKVKQIKKEKQIITRNSYSVKEIFFSQWNQNLYNRLDIIVRYLAIENYYGLNECGFGLYRKMQRARVGNENLESRITEFKNIIHSFESHGYLNESEITIDEHLQLLDGSHRMALCLYFGIESINCKVMKLCGEVSYSIEWFIENDFSIDEIEIILNKYDKICRRLGKGLIAVILWPPVQDYFNEITQKLALEYKIDNYYDYLYPEVIFERFVKGIYAVDDIDDWKINEKIRYMSNYTKQVRILYLETTYPNFRLKNKNYSTISKKGESIKKAIRGCYLFKVENYFHDIIIHTADNFMQSEFIKELVNLKLPLIDYYDSIKNYQYMLIKTDVEYMSDDYPKDFPLSKDIDVIVSKEDINALVEHTEKFFIENVQKNYKVIKICKDKNIKIRIELVYSNEKSFMIYMFDFFTEIEGINNKFIEESLKRRIRKKNYFIDTEEDEIYYRINEYYKNNTKKYHLNWVKNHRSLFMENHARDALVNWNIIMDD